MRKRILAALLATAVMMSSMAMSVVATDYEELSQPYVSHTFATNELSVVNFAPVWGDKDANVASMIEYVEEAADLGVKILLFPEMCVTGYASSSNASSETYQMPIELAESVDGPTAATFSALAVEYDMWIIYGASETIEGDSDHAYNSAFACSPEGEVVSYQKITPVEGTWCTPGETPVILDAGEYGLMGLSICYDTYATPELERYYVAQGCNLLLNPTATSRSYSDIDGDGVRDDIGWEWYYKDRLETIASRDGLTILSANLVGTDGPTGNYNFPGGSVILNGSFSGACYYAGEVDSTGKTTTTADIITGVEGLLTNSTSSVKASTGSTTSHEDFAPELYAQWYAELADMQDAGESLSYRYSESDGPLAAVVNMSAVWGDKEANLSAIIEYVIEAGEAGVEFLVFPETVLTGYEYIDPLTDTIEDSDEMMQVLLAETIPGPSTYTLSEYAQMYDMYIVVGMSEKEEEPMYEDGVEKVYNSAAIMYPDGTIDSYQKMHRAGYESKWSLPGDTPVFIETEWGKFGIDICRDGHFYPELGRYYAAMGCNLLVHPTATTGNPWYRESRIGSYTDRDGMAAITCNLLGPDGIYNETTDSYSGGTFSSTSLIITKYSADHDTSFNYETGSAIDLNGTGSESEGYDERGTSPEGLEIAQMNLADTGFSVSNFNPRLFSEMYDELAVTYREGYTSIYADDAALDATVSVVESSVDIAAGTSTFDVVLDSATGMKALFVTLDASDDFEIVGVNGFSVSDFLDGTYMLAYSEGTDDTFTGTETVAATITVTGTAGATVSLENVVVATTAAQADAVLTADSASSEDTFTTFYTYDVNGDGVVNYSDIASIVPFYGSILGDSIYDATYDVAGEPRGSIGSEDYLAIYSYFAA